MSSRRSKLKARRASPSTSPHARPPAKRAWWRIATIVLVGVVAYANSLSGPFVLDDRVTILENSSIRRLSSPRVFAAVPVNFPRYQRSADSFFPDLGER
jgi:hypothetical protein